MSYGLKSWVMIQDEDVPGVVYAGVDVVDGHPRIVQLYIDGRGEPIQAGALRRFPLGAYEQLIATMTDSAGTPFTFHGASWNGPNLSMLAARNYVETGDEYHGRHCPTCSAPLKRDEARAKSAGREEAITDWVALERMARQGDIEQPPMPPDRFPATDHEPVRLAAPEHGLTDEFLQDVGRAYQAAVEQRKPPATAIAEASGVSVRTAQSWIYKARKRGIMPPAAKKGRIV